MEQLPSRRTVYAREPRVWNIPTRLLFRFSFVYLALVLFPFPLTGSFKLTTPRQGVDEFPPFWDKVVTPLAAKLFRGSMDTLGQSGYEYAKILLFVAIAVASTAAWSMLQRNKAEHSKLHAWVKLYVRIALGCEMLYYGVAKILPGQFPLSLSRLLQPFGDATPQGLLWTFMAFSRPYQVFTGVVETAGALLLFFPRTATAGALISMAALVNVVVLDFSYGVFVKVWAVQLLLMAVFIAAPDLGALTRLLIFRRPVNPAAETPLASRPWLAYSLVAVQLLFGVSWFSAQIKVATADLAKDAAQRPALYGIWTVDEFALDGVTHPALISDGTRWRYVVFDEPREYGGTNFAVLTNDSRQMFWARLDKEEKTIGLTRGRDAYCEPDKLGESTECPIQTQFTVEHLTLDSVVMDGQLEAHRVHAQLRRTPMKFTLTSAPIGWNYGLTNR